MLALELELSRKEVGANGREGESSGEDESGAFDRKSK